MDLRRSQKDAGAVFVWGKTEFFFPGVRYIANRRLMQ